MTKLDLAAFQEVISVVVTLADLSRKIIATKAEDVAKIDELKAEVEELTQQIAELSTDNTSANSLIPELKAQLDALVAEATAAIPTPVEPTPEPTPEPAPEA